MAAVESIATNETIELNTSAKLIAYIIGSDSKDCSFKFVDENTKEIRTIAAQSKLLAACSPVFATMFNDNWSHGSKEIAIDEVSFESFETFMSALYKAEAELSMANIQEIAYLAHKYDVKELGAACESFAISRISIDTVLQYSAMGTLYGQPKLVDKCAEFISGNTEEVLQSEAFMQCDIETLERVLKTSKMSCKEHIVFDSCIEWAKHQCRLKKINDLLAGNLRTELGDSFKLIRFTEMDRSKFMARYETYKEMFLKDYNVGDVFMHFMQMPLTDATVIRYIRPKHDITDITYTFPLDQKIHKVEGCLAKFRLSQSLMLKGLTVNNPCLVGTSEYPPFDISIEVTKFATNHREYEVKSKTLSGKDCTRIDFPQPWLIERNFVYKLSINFPFSHNFDVSWRSCEVGQHYSHSTILRFIHPHERVELANPGRPYPLNISALHFRQFDEKIADMGAMQ